MRVIRLLGACALLGALALGCPVRRDGLSRDALLRSLEGAEDGAGAGGVGLEAIRALRVPALPAPPRGPAPDDLVGRARWAAAVAVDRAGLEEAWSAPTTPGERRELLAHRCLVEAAALRGAAAAEACAAFLDGWAADPRAVGVASTLAGLGSLTAAGDRLARERGEAWLVTCAAARVEHCAELAHVVFGAAQRAASGAHDEADARALTRRRGSLARARQEGPLQGDPALAFAAVTWGETLTPRPRRYVAVDVEPWDGRFTPALRSEAGLYRLRFSGTTRPGRAQLFVAARGPVRVSIDGETVFERLASAPVVPVATVDVELRGGAHRVDVLSWVGSGGDPVELALLDDKGAPVWSDGPSRRGVGVRVVPRGAAKPAPEVGWGAELDRDLLFLARADQGLGATPGEARARARRLLAAHGYAPAALAAAARWLEADPALTRPRARAEVAPLYAALEARAPGHPAAALARYEALVDEQPDEAGEVLRALTEAWPDLAAGHRRRAELALRRGRFDEALLAAEALEQLEPSEANVEAMLAVREQAHQTVREQALRQRRVELAPDLYGDARARFLLEAGQAAEGIAELQRICDAEPGHLAEEALWDLLELEAPAQALARLEQHLKRFPNDRTAWRRRVDVLHATAGVNAARAAAAAALERFGANRSLWGIAEELGHPPPWADRRTVVEGALQRWRSADPPPYRGQPWVFVLDRLEHHLFEDQSQVTVRHFVVELQSRDAVDAFGEVRIGNDEELRRLVVVKPDGTEREPDYHRNVEDISLSGLEPGDLVEMVTVAYQESPPADGISFEVHPLLGPAPAATRQLVYELPASWTREDEFEVVQTMGAPAPVVDENGERRRFSFELLLAEPLLAEPDSLLDIESAPAVGYRRGLSLDDWAALRGGPYARQAETDPWLADAARRIAGEGPDEERLSRLVSFVFTEIEAGDEPRRAGEVLAEGRGFRLPLLWSLARAARLEVAPVALHLTRVAPPLELPHGTRFALLGLQFRVAGRERFLFGDGTFGGLQAVPPSARDAKVLDLRLDEEPSRPLLGFFGLSEARLSDLPDDAVADDPAFAQLDLEVKGDRMAGLLLLTVPRHQATPVRDALLAASPEQLKAVFEGAVGGTLPGASATAVRTPGLSRHGEALVIGVDLVVPLDAPAAGAGSLPHRLEHLFADGATTPLGLLPSLNRLLQVAERRRPLLVSAGHEVLEVALRLPAGGTFTEVPEKSELTAGPVELSQRVEVTDGVFYLRREITLEATKVSPEDWRTLRPQLARLAGQVDGRLSFLQTGPPRTAVAPGQAPASAARSEPGTEVGQ